MTTVYRAANEIEVGVVGLGLMGTSIIASLLLAGHRVVAVAPLPEDLDGAEGRIVSQLHHGEQTGLLNEPVANHLQRLAITEDYADLRHCKLVMECVIELVAVKESVYKKIAAAVAADAVISTNTSALPITFLQGFVPNPGRFLGIHWAEPAYMTRFLEVTCGEQTALRIAEWICELAGHWGKEPTLLRKDIRGFITNRLMYAMYREALSLVEKGETTLEDVDKAFRYDPGSWMTLMGVFRRMDYLGLPNQLAVLEKLVPQLETSGAVPELMKKIVAERGRGVQNGRGFFEYSEEEGRKWEEAFAAFNQDIFHLAEKYPSETTEPAC